MTKKEIAYREALRRTFLDDCDAFLEADQPKLVEFELIKNKYGRLVEKMENSGNSFDEDERCHEMFIRAEVKAKNLEPMKLMTVGVSPVGYKLPKLEVTKYDVSPKTWIAFWGQFKGIHEDRSLREEDKFQYLKTSLKEGTKARRIVEGYPPSAANYSKVIGVLKVRFGSETAIIESYTRDLIQLVLGKRVSNLGELYDTLSSKILALESLGVTTNNVSAVLYPLVQSTLPADVAKLWERQRTHVRDFEGGADDVSVSDVGFMGQANPLKELMNFLEQEVLAEERLALSKVNVSNANAPTKTTMKPNDSVATAAALVAQPAEAEKKKFKEKCIFCGKEHKISECEEVHKMTMEEREEKIKNSRRCFHCLRSGHFSKFCRSIVTCSKCKGNHQTVLHREKEVALYVGELKEKVYLKTVMIKLDNTQVRVLLDDGSTRSYIREELARKLNLKPIGKEFTSHSLFGGMTTKGREHKIFEIKVASVNMSFLEVPQICCNIPRVDDENLMRKLEAKGIYLSDVGPGTPEIDMLIGAQGLGSLMTGKCVPFNCGVTAIETKLGWSLIGSSPGMKESKAMCHFALSNLWTLEALGIESGIESEKEVMMEFANTVKRDKDGRYEVALPWKVGHPSINDNRSVAEARVRRVMSKLAENDRNSYGEVFKRWEADGIVERVENDVENDVVHYLPHRPVFRPGSSTPVRPVFDASCKGVNGVSLNDCLEKGPNLIKTIPSTLTRFRSGKLGVIADIKSAFLQIKIQKKDRDAMRFLWLNDDDKIEEFRHCRVVFGVSSSPFLLNATIGHHLESMTENADIVEKLRGSFYVDDCVTSVDTEEELDDFVKRASEVMLKGCFELRKWAHNGEMQLYDQNVVKVNVLGLKWDIQADMLFINVNANLRNAPLTKRGVLSIVSQIFDPIGFLAPALIVPKIMLQEMWKEKLEWDEELPKTMQKKVKKWMEQLDEIENLRVPRWFHHGLSSMECCTLHIFADGSSQAYACCVFLRCECNGVVDVKFVGCKARVVPTEKLTIPRIELLAALIAVKFVETLDFPPNVQKCFYTDSSVVFAWITNSIPWKTWVGNRVTEIREKSCIDQWWHVDGVRNPADLPSRGCGLGFLSQSGWEKGPSWLLEPSDKWPCRKLYSVPEEARTEAKIVDVMTLTASDNGLFSEDLLYFSDFPKIVRMVSWMMRFVNRVSKRAKLEGPLTANELEDAEKKIFMLVQKEALEIKKHSNLSLEKNDDGLIYVKTRLVKMNDVSDNFISPVVLVEHPLVNRMIEYEHRKNCHAGVSTLLAILRERVWLLRGRQIIKKVVRSCGRCKRFSASNVMTKTAPLPAERVNTGAVFQTTGVDLAGPLLLKDGQKAWIVLFTCAVFRAVHLELVTSLSTDAFLMSLRRFIARRGRCEVLWSDQGTNFKGAERAMSSIDWERVTDECGVKKIKWMFNPAAAPWWGGWWERLVGVVKNSLKRTLGTASLNYEEMLTVLADVEGVVNKRPLTYVGDELLPLTPWDFMTDAGKPEATDLDEISSAFLVKRAKYIQRVRDHLKERFRKEYIGLLGCRPQKEKGKLAVGDVVLVGSDNTKRVMWPLARILEFYPGKDGVFRVAKVRTATGESVRAVQRLYPLEADKTFV